MAWSQETLKRIGEPIRHTHPEFARLLREVSSGRLDKEQAWKMWEQYKEQAERPETVNPCQSCDGYGGFAMLGSMHGTHVCQCCGGTGREDT